MNTIEQKVAEIIQDTLIELGFDLVIVRLQSSNPKVLEILVERLDGDRVTIEDCSNLSRNISALLDVEDVISNKYYLEVSSPGIERPLVKYNDYTKFINREVSIKLQESLNGKTNYHGKIVKVEDQKIYLAIKEESIILPFELIKKAHLVLTDEMFKALLNKKS